MNAIQFIQKHGIEKTRKVIEDAPDLAEYYSTIDGEYYRIEINAVNLKQLKRLVESIYLVKEHCTLERAKKYADSPYTAPEIKEQIRSHIKNESLYFSDDAMSEYTLLEILEMEKELLGIYITGDPFDVVLKAVKERHFLATDVEIAVGEKGSFSGMIVAKITGNRGIKTRTGKDMCFLSAEDHKGNSFSMTAFDNVYSKSKLIMRNGNYLACYVNAKPSYKNDGTIDYVISSVIDLSEDMKKVSKDISKTKLIKEAVVST
jgi:DNA polymerase III alpha subunit